MHTLYTHATVIFIFHLFNDHRLGHVRRTDEQRIGKDAEGSGSGWTKKRHKETPNQYGQCRGTDRREIDASNISSIVACVFVAASTCLPSRCLATIRRIHRQQSDFISLLLFFSK
jgi:hypothetical protein